MKKMKFRSILQANMPWLILLVIAGIFSVIAPRFFSLRNVVNILDQNAYIIICAIGVTFLMMAGNLDLSTGYMMSFIAVTMGKLSVAGVSTPILILYGIVAGIVLTEINMFLAIKLKITMLMTTVGTMSLYQGASYLISKSRSFQGFTDSFKFLGQGRIANFPFSVIVAFFFVILMSLFLSKTYWGRYIYAVGGSEEAARLSGINIVFMKILIAGIAGLFVGLSSVMLVSKVGIAQSGLGPGTEMTCITAILIGGVSLRGGEGKISGVVAGVLILAILNNGMQLANWDPNAQYCVKGVIMLAAIGFDVFQMSHRKIEIDKSVQYIEEP